MPSTPSSIISSKKARTLLGSAPSNRVVLVVTRKPRFTAALDSLIVTALAANREVVMFLLAVDVDRKSQILARLEKIELFLEQQRIRAEIDVLFAGHQAFDNLVDLR